VVNSVDFYLPKVVKFILPVTNSCFLLVDQMIKIIGGGVD
jgi:hypothetical protein